jgi:hypothetical protein
MAANELRPLTLAAKTEILELNDRHHRVVVIGFDKVDIAGADSRGAV